MFLQPKNYNFQRSYLNKKNSIKKKNRKISIHTIDTTSHSDRIHRWMLALHTVCLSSHRNSYVTRGRNRYILQRVDDTMYVLYTRVIYAYDNGGLAVAHSVGILFSGQTIAHDSFDKIIYARVYAIVVIDTYTMYPTYTFICPVQITNRLFHPWNTVRTTTLGIRVDNDRPTMSQRLVQNIIILIWYF
jgi:hypothetical protein